MNNLTTFFKEHRVLKKLFAYGIGSYFMAASIPLLVSTGIGLSGPDSYITSICRGFGWDPTTSVYGYIIWVHYAILWTCIVIVFGLKTKIRKKQLRKYDYFYILSMLVPVFLTGPLVSINNLWIPNIVKKIDPLWSKYIIFIFGIIFSTFGSSLVVWSNMLIEPHSAIVLEARDIIKKPIFFLRICLDSIFFLLAIIIGYSTKQNVFEFNIINISGDANTGPLISYSTIIFVITNGIFFGWFVKMWKKFLGKNK